MKVALVGWADPLFAGMIEGDGHTLCLSGRDQMNACDIAFICVPQPEVDDVMRWLRVPLIVIRTTMPEFCRDHEWTTFANSPHIHVVYQPICDTWLGLVVAAGTKAQEVCDFWRPILGEDATYVATSWRQAERIRATVEQYTDGLLTPLERKLLELMGDGVRTVLDHQRRVSLAD